jgi:hypothetical protein
LATDRQDAPPQTKTGTAIGRACVDFKRNSDGRQPAGAVVVTPVAVVVEKSNIGDPSIDRRSGLSSSQGLVV